MILLDTNVISELMKARPDPAVVAWLDEQDRATVFTSAITRAEIALGIALLPDGQRKELVSAAAALMFAEFAGRLLPFDEAAAGHYGQLVAGRTRSGRPVAVEDAQIAAIALANGLSLATRNTRDFADIPGLLLINPWP